VSLASYLDNDGIAFRSADRVGLDGRGHAFPAQELPPGGPRLAGTPYAVDPIGADNVVARGQTLPLPPGRYASLGLLVTSSYGPAGGTLTVRYADGTRTRESLSAPGPWTRRTG
jgi:hypothetical protein